MIEANNNNENILKRTHKKPYKVGKLFFGRSSNERGASWVVSSNPDLSNPEATFDIGKLARSYCEEQRDIAKANKANMVSTGADDSASTVEIPSGEEPFGSLEDLEVDSEGFVQI